MLKQQIEQEVRAALKAGETLRLSALRMFLAAIHNEEIAIQKEASDEVVAQVARRLIKQRREAAEAFLKGGREELAQKEEAEAKILSNYLPQQLSEEEVIKIVKETIESLSETEKSNFGKVMGAVMAKVKGQADGNVVSKAVKEALQQP